MGNATVKGREDNDLQTALTSGDDGSAMPRDNGFTPATVVSATTTACKHIVPSCHLLFIVALLLGTQLSALVALLASLLLVTACLFPNLKHFSLHPLFERSCCCLASYYIISLCCRNL